jgi:hypothetical protein
MTVMLSRTRLGSHFIPQSVCILVSYLWLSSVCVCLAAKLILIPSIKYGPAQELWKAPPSLRSLLTRRAVRPPPAKPRSTRTDLSSEGRPPMCDHHGRLCICGQRKELSASHLGNDYGRLLETEAPNFCDPLSLTVYGPFRNIPPIRRIGLANHTPPVRV